MTNILIESTIERYNNAMRKMGNYFAKHNYGKDDHPTYSKDPEWQRLNAELVAASNAYDELI